MTFGGSILHNLFALLFPPRADAARIAQLTADDMHAHYALQTHDHFTALASYHNPIVRACIRELKFHNSAHGARLLGTLLRKYLAEHVRRDVCIIPIPLSTQRHRERGYNQVERILISAGVRPVHALTRVRNTAPQTTLDRNARLQNLTNAFAVRTSKRTSIADAHVLIIDDVTTTGATLAAARAALTPYRPASITCLAIAH